MIDILLTFLLNALPLAILLVPLIFLRNKLSGKLYARIVLGIFVFYLIYWVLPVIFQFGNKPVYLESEGNTELLGVGYILTHTFSLISLFAFYPLVTLPFIFFMAPIFTFLGVRRKLKKEDGSLKENLTQLAYEYNESPYVKIKEELIRNDWSREKEILKLMIVLLPISLYLLQVILDISNLQSVSLTTGETALGWFLEILFVYLATFIFSIELLSSSKIAFKGRYFGEDIREQTYKSLYSVGAPISILSLILFIIQYTSSIFIIIYFFAYFIMASIIFVLFLNIFEPISILILIKLLNWLENKDKKMKKISFNNFYYPILFGAVAIFTYFFLNLLLFGTIYLALFGEPGTNSHDLILKSANFAYDDPGLRNALLFDAMNIFALIVSVVTPLFLSIYLLSLSLKYVRSSFVGYIIYIPIIILFSLIFYIIGINPLINFAPEEFWITGQISTIDFGQYEFFTLRTADFEANLFEGGNVILGGIAVPYLYTRYIFNIVIWSLLLYYAGKQFKIKNIPLEGNEVEKRVYSTEHEFLTFEEYIDDETSFLVSKVPDVQLKGPEASREDIASLLAKLESDQLLASLKPQDKEEKKRFYFTLKYLFFQGKITLWKPEFSYTYERPEKQGLYIIFSDGRDVFNYQFTEAGQQDPGLVSGMFSAITSFVKETTKSTQYLKTIDHGDITILIEYGDFILAAMFVKGKQSAELREQLREMVNQFEEKHRDVLPNWDGALAPFRDDEKLVKEIFLENQ